MRFRDAREKVRWARKRHIPVLADVVTRFLSSGPYKLVSERDSEGRHLVRARIVRVTDPDIALLVGDATHNLRSALDSVVWRLVKEQSDAGQVSPPLTEAQERGIAFPVTDAPGGYADRVNSAAGHAGADSVRVLTTIGAYQGGPGHALWQLHKLDIVDKHRLVLAVAAKITTLTAGPREIPEFRAAAKRMGLPSIVEEMVATPLVFHDRDVRPIIPLEDGAILWGPSTVQPDMEIAEATFDVIVTEAAIVEPTPIVPLLSRFADAVDEAIDTLEREAPNPAT